MAFNFYDSDLSTAMRGYVFTTADPVITNIFRTNPDEIKNAIQNHWQELDQYCFRGFIPAVLQEAKKLNAIPDLSVEHMKEIMNALQSKYYVSRQIPDNVPFLPESVVNYIARYESNYFTNTFDFSQYIATTVPDKLKMLGIEL